MTRIKEKIYFLTHCIALPIKDCFDNKERWYPVAKKVLNKAVISETVRAMTCQQSERAENVFRSFGRWATEDAISQSHIPSSIYIATKLLLMNWKKYSSIKRLHHISTLPKRYAAMSAVRNRRKTPIRKTFSSFTIQDVVFFPHPLLLILNMETSKEFLLFSFIKRKGEQKNMHPEWCKSHTLSVKQ